MEESSIYLTFSDVLGVGHVHGLCCQTDCLRPPIFHIHVKEDSGELADCTQLQSIWHSAWRSVNGSSYYVGTELVPGVGEKKRLTASSPECSA